MNPSLLSVMNAHPALGVVLSCTVALLGTFFYLSVRRFCTMVERVNRERCGRKPAKREAAPAAEEKPVKVEAAPAKETQLREMLVSLGYKSFEIDRVIGVLDEDCTSVWKNDIQDLLKKALRQMPNKSRVS